MAIFSALEIVSVLHVCEKQMKGLSKYLFDISQTDAKEKYILDCDKINESGINSAIDAAFRRLLHARSTREGLIEFAGKFPELEIEIGSEIFEKDIIVKISQYSDKMLQMIDGNIDVVS